MGTVRVIFRVWGVFCFRVIIRRVSCLLIRAQVCGWLCASSFRASRH